MSLCVIFKIYETAGLKCFYVIYLESLARFMLLYYFISGVYVHPERVHLPGGLGSHAAHHGQQ